MADILDEVKEIEREEKSQAFLKILLKVVGILALISIAVTAVISWYNERQNNRTYEVISQLTSTLRKINTPEANNTELAKDIEVLSDGSLSYNALANFYLAAISIANGNLNKAAYYYDKVQSNNNYDSTIRTHAAINSVSIKLQNNSISPEQAIKLINKVTLDNRHNPFAIALNMLQASIFVETKQFEEAARELDIAITSSKNDGKSAQILSGMSMYVNAKLQDNPSSNEDNKEIKDNKDKQIKDTSINNS